MSAADATTIYVFVAIGMFIAGFCAGMFAGGQGKG